LQILYEKALRGAYSVGFGNEFHSIDDTPDVLKKRNYENIKRCFLCLDKLLLL